MELLQSPPVEEQALTLTTGFLQVEPLHQLPASLQELILSPLRMRMDALDHHRRTSRNLPRLPIHPLPLLQIAARAMELLL